MTKNSGAFKCIGPHETRDRLELGVRCQLAMSALPVSVAALSCTSKTEYDLPAKDTDEC
jgi:hypothetical protein